MSPPFDKGGTNTMTKKLLVILLVLLTSTVYAGRVNLKVLNPGTSTASPTNATPSYPLIPEIKGSIAVKGTGDVDIRFWGWDRYGPVTLGTDSYTLAATDIVEMNDLIREEELWGFKALASGGDIIWNSTSNLATGSDYCGERWQDGVEYQWNFAE